MASVNFCELILNDAAELSDQMAFPTMNAWSVAIDTPGEVRQYANGTTRLISRAGTKRTARARLPLITRDQIAWLEAHARRMVLVRDGQGRAFYAAYLSPSFDETGYNGEAVTEIVLSELTYSSSA